MLLYLRNLIAFASASKTLTTLFFFSLFFNARAQIFPREGSKLNYRIVGFTFPGQVNSSSYAVQLADGYYTNDDSFKSSGIRSFTGTENKILGEVPAFGHEYTWRVITTDKSGKKNGGPLYHFSTMYITEVDTSLKRLRILESAKKYKDGYVFLDVTRTLYDMKGMPVWFLPNVDGLKMESSTPLDLKLSSAGTITFICTQGAYEIDYNGNVLWKGPNNQPQDQEVAVENQYHHEFTRLQNGNYMILGTEKIYNKLPLTENNFLKDTRNVINAGEDSLYRELVFVTLLEYDKKGNIVWSWKVSKYARESDMFYWMKNNRWRTKLHENAFYFDEQNKAVYLSFRDVSRVVKIKYPEGNVVATYGDLFSPGAEPNRQSLFCAQHACKRTHDGYLYLFNNNDCHAGELPKLIMMQENDAVKGGLKKAWEFTCSIDDKHRSIDEHLQGQGGGNVQELPDGSFFASMGRGYCKLFVVSRDKQTLWSAIPEQKNIAENRWDMNPSYRGNIVFSKRDLEKLVWNSITP